jgi:maltooligosyltrehalose trehalohydrolase
MEQQSDHTRKPGAWLHNGNCTFTVWAPHHASMQLHIVEPAAQLLPMQSTGDGYFTLRLPVSGRCRYYYRLPNGTDHPDPASHYQPLDVGGPSEVVDHAAYRWHDGDWKGLPFNSLVFYELHTGTFTGEGNFEAITGYLDYLVQLGVNAVELMPVAQFPGTRNWGYDGVFPYAVQHSYGGPQALKRLVDACHQKGIAVFLDVVFNHLGPEGNWLPAYAPYFSQRYTTPWGDALNYDGEYSDEVRAYFAGNMEYWFTQYHIDGLRMDAIHEIYDRGAVPFWELLYEKRRLLEQRLGRPLYLVAECDLNSPRVVRHPQAGGWGFEAQWLDDFHHALYVLLDADGKKHYVDFGEMEQLAKAFKEGFVHSGEYVSFRKRRHGASAAGIPGHHFVVFSQNHDLVGNRPGGERLSMLVDLPRLKLAAAAVLLSPYIPLLFMGEEFAAQTPFYFFASPSGEDVIRGLREGRKKDFSIPEWDKLPPDAVDPAVFGYCKLQWSQRDEAKGRELLQWYKDLLALRKKEAVLQNTDKNSLRVNLPGEKLLVLHRRDTSGGLHLLCCFHFGSAACRFSLPAYAGSWQLLLHSHGEEACPAVTMAGETVELPSLSVVVFRGNA